MSTNKVKKARKAREGRKHNIVRLDSRTCFGISFFLSEEEAQAYAAEVRERGETYNGGWFHGMACGRDETFDYVIKDEDQSIETRQGFPQLPVGTQLYAVTTA